MGPLVWLASLFGAGGTADFIANDQKIMKSAQKAWKRKDLSLEERAGIVGEELDSAWGKVKVGWSETPDISLKDTVADRNTSQNTDVVPAGADTPPETQPSSGNEDKGGIWNTLTKTVNSIFGGKDDPDISDSDLEKIAKAVGFPATILALGLAVGKYAGWGTGLMVSITAFGVWKMGLDDMVMGEDNKPAPETLEI